METYKVTKPLVRDINYHRVELTSSPSDGRLSVELTELGAGTITAGSPELFFQIAAAVEELKNEYAARQDEKDTK